MVELKNNKGVRVKLYLSEYTQEPHAYVTADWEWVASNAYNRDYDRFESYIQSIELEFNAIFIEFNQSEEFVTNDEVFSELLKVAENLGFVFDFKNSH